MELKIFLFFFGKPDFSVAFTGGLFYILAETKHASNADMTAQHDYPRPDFSGDLTAKDHEALNGLFEAFRANPCDTTRDAMITAAYFRIRSFFMELYLSGKFTESAVPDQLLTRAFGKFIRKHQHIRHTYAFSRWLQRLCLREYYKFRRAAVRFVTTNNEDVTGGAIEIDDAILSEIDRDTLIRIITDELNHTLHPRVMETLVYKLTTHFTNDEIAVKMGINSQSVKNCYHRAISVIRNSERIKTIILKWKENTL